MSTMANMVANPNASCGDLLDESSAVLSYAIDQLEAVIEDAGEAIGPLYGTLYLVEAAREMLEAANGRVPPDPDAILRFHGLGQQSMLRAPEQELGHIVVEVRGGDEDSDIHPGDLVAIDLTVRSFDSDGVYVIAFGGGLVFRRVQRIPKEDRTWLCLRQGGKYEPMSDEVLLSIEVIGRVKEVYHSDRNEPSRRRVAA